MQQHKVQTQKKNVAHEIHKANIERELLDDEKRLQELENKLKEVSLFFSNSLPQLYDILRMIYRFENRNSSDNSENYYANVLD